MAANLGVLGQAADLATQAYEDAKQMYQGILMRMGELSRQMSREATLENFKYSLNEFGEIEKLIDQVDGLVSDEMKRDRIINRYRVNIGKGLKTINDKLDVLEARFVKQEKKIQEAQRKILEEQEKEPAPGPEAGDNGAPNGDDKEIPWLPIAIGGGALLVALGMS